MTTPAHRADAAPDAAADAEQEANNLIKRGLDLRRDGDDTRAISEILKAYELVRSPRAAAQLGLVEIALGRWPEADAHLKEALSAQKDGWIRKNRAVLQESLQQVRTHIGQLELTGEPVGAEYYVDGKMVGKLPLATPVVATAGTIDVDLRAPGHVRAGKRVTLAPGGYERVFIRLDSEPRAGTSTSPTPAVTPPVPAAPPPEHLTHEPRQSVPPDSTPPAPRHSGLRRTLTWTALGASVAFLVTGVVGSVVHEQAISDFSSKTEPNPPGGYRCFDRGGSAVDATGQPAAEDCQTLLGRAQSANTIAAVGYVGGGLLAATWLYLVLTKPEEATAAQVAWSCAPSLVNVGAGCQLRF